MFKKSLLTFFSIFLSFNSQAVDIVSSPKSSELSACQTELCQTYFHKFKLAAKRGHSEAYTTLGQFYYNGYGVEKDEAQALKYLKKASKYGEPAAQYKTGLIHLISEQHLDAKESIKYLKKAAFRDYKDANILLGVLHFNNQFIEQDLAISDSYLIRAYREEHPKIPEVINALERQGLFNQTNFPMLFATTLTDKLEKNAQNEFVWPKDEDIEVITVTSPPITDILDQQLLSYRKHIKTTGSRLKGKQCATSIGCHIAIGRQGLEGFPSSFLGVRDATGSGGLSARSSF
ncbi:tetratricopeptide repeat protein [Thalassotalea montiporae]